MRILLFHNSIVWSNWISVNVQSRAPAYFQNGHQSVFSAIRPILVRMFRMRKNPTVETPINTSATQKAMSQLCRLAIVLKGSPAMKAPTVTTRKFVIVIQKMLKRRISDSKQELTAYH